VIQATGTLAQLQELQAIGWLSQAEYDILAECMRRLRRSRMMSALLPGPQEQPMDTQAAADVFIERLGGSGWAAKDEPAE
jgi:hypothetical protein